MIDRPQIAASETVEVRNLSQRAQDASVVGRRKVHLLVLPHDPIDVDRCEPFIFEQPAQAAPKERCVVADGGAARPHHQEGQERSLAGENDALPPSPIRIRFANQSPSRAGCASSADEATWAPISVRSFRVQRIKGMTTAPACPEQNERSHSECDITAPGRSV